MAGASISHALIVAGPSGAGKSTFLRVLAAGGLPQDIQRLLPADAHVWPVIFCDRRNAWESLIARDGALPGIAIHYDVTSKWRTLDNGLESDPFWRVLDHCQAATLINIRPSEHRLLQQWMHAHLGVRSVWGAHLRHWVGIRAHHLLTRLRRLRTRPSRRKPGVHVYPRRLRFLRRLDSLLHRLHLKPKPSFQLYRQRGTVARMLQSWDAATAARLARLPVTRIEIMPDDGAEIAKTFDWRMVAVEPPGAGRH